MGNEAAEAGNQINTSKACGSSCKKRHSKSIIFLASLMDLVQPTQHKLDIQFSLQDLSKLIFSQNFRVCVSLLCIEYVGKFFCVSSNFLRWCIPVQNNEIQFEFLFLHLRCSGLDSSSSIAGLHQCSLPVMEFCIKTVFLHLLFRACSFYFFGPSGHLFMFQ